MYSQLGTSSVGVPLLPSLVTDNDISEDDGCTYAGEGPGIHKLYGGMCHG